MVEAKSEREVEVKDPKLPLVVVKEVVKKLVEVALVAFKLVTVEVP